MNEGKSQFVQAPHPTKERKGYSRAMNTRSQYAPTLMVLMDDIMSMLRLPTGREGTRVCQLTVWDFLDEAGSSTSRTPLAVTLPRKRFSKGTGQGRNLSLN